MKVAIIGQKGIPAKYGGVEAHVEILSTRLVQAGHEVFVYTRPNYTDPALDEYKGVKLISLKSIGTKHLDAITHTLNACFDVAKRDVDIIHFHSIGPSSLIWLVKLLKPRTPVIATFHTRCYEHQKWGKFAKFCLKTAEKICCYLSDQTIAVSKTLASYAQDKYNREIAYVPNGVEIRQIPAAELIQQWGLAEGSYVVAVSRLVKHKGLHYLIEAYKKIETDKKLVIVGDSAFTDDYVKQIKKIAENDPRIIFTGNQSGEALSQLFANAYLFVQPSESEGLSIALLEAMSYRRAVLVSDIQENLEAIGEDMNKNFIFENKSIRDLREKIIYLLAQPELVRKQGNKNQQRVIQNYNWRSIIKDVTKIYKQSLIDKVAQRQRFARLRVIGRIFGIFL